MAIVFLVVIIHRNNMDPARYYKLMKFSTAMND